MSNQITMIDFDGNSLGTKPLITSDTLTSIREKIKERVNAPYIIYIFRQKWDTDK